MIDGKTITQIIKAVFENKRWKKIGIASKATVKSHMIFSILI